MRMAAWFTQTGAMFMVYHVLGIVYSRWGVSQKEIMEKLSAREYVYGVKNFLHSRRISDDTASRDRFMDPKSLQCLDEGGSARSSTTQDTLENDIPTFGCYAKLLCEQS